MCAIYLYNLPLVFIARLDAGGLHFGVGAFRPRIRKETAKKPKKARRRRVPPGLIWRIFKAATLERLDVRVTIGTDDAALTAQICGLAMILLSTVRAVTGAAGKSSVTPDFSGRTLSGELRGIARLTLGHIMKAALSYQFRGAGG
jgi:hypothetical protein